ncbi:MAG: gephyrin-like molybdotransferase Glp [Pseudomonadota bacterium]
MLSVEEARARVLTLVAPLGAERVALADASGRTLAEDAAAARAQPPFAASAMDGYAVRAAEAVPGARLAVAGEAAAGHRAACALPPAAAIRIFTGAPLPEGADSILIQENAARDGDTITVAEAPAPDAYVRPAGGDFAAGSILAAPNRLGPREIGLLAAMNVAEPVVARRPVVALMATGDELVWPGETPGPDQIIASSAPALAARVAAAGAIPRLCPIARDTRESLLAALEVARGADILVTLGGASVGDHDLVAEVLGGAGLALDFYKIRMRPGKPLMAGRLHDGMAMLGLPGNPVSAMVCAELFLVPAIDRCLGWPAEALAPRFRIGLLAHDLEANGDREHYMRATLAHTADGQAHLTVAKRQDSSLLSVLADASALVRRMPGAPAAAAGTRVEYLPLD